MSDSEQRDRQPIKKNERESDSPSSSQLPIISSSELPEGLRQVLEVELARIESQNRQTDNRRRAIEANDAANQRQYDFQIKALENQREKDVEYHKIGSRLLTIFVAGSFIVIGILLFNAFWGDDINRGTALDILKYAFTGIGGYGVFRMLERMVRQFFANR